MNDKLQKILAHAGLGSRRELETWIEAGRVTVNGKRAKLGDRASARDRILVDGRLISVNEQRQEPIKALVYHKPEGQICSQKDPKGRPTVFDDLPSLPGGRWVSVGRLDLNSSGLLLFTNNGNLANRLMHPSTGLEREYLVRIRGRASEQSIATLVGKGVTIDGQLARFQSVTPADLSEEGTNHWYRVIICEGRYREVRRMWDAVGHTVSRLKRIRYASVKLTRDLRQGQHSKMAPKQLEKLVSTAGLLDEFKDQVYSSRQSKAAPTTRAKRKPNIRNDKDQSNRRSSSRPSTKSSAKRGTASGRSRSRK